MKANKTAIFQLLQWPAFEYDFPPIESSWSKRNEEQVLTWLSTRFTTQYDFFGWLHEKKLLNLENMSIVPWLLPDVELSEAHALLKETNITKSLLFVYNCLEKALLWFNPERSWPSSLHLSIERSRQLLKEFLCEESSIKLQDKASSFLGRDGWGDFGWLQHHPEYGDFIHIYYETLLFSQDISNNKSQIMTLVERAKEALFFAVTTFWEGIDRFKYKHDYLYDEELDRILKYEELWCKKVFEKGPLLNWDCISTNDYGLPYWLESKSPP